MPFITGVYTMVAHSTLIISRRFARRIISLMVFSLIVSVSPVYAQAILFDFDNAPLSTSLPIYQTSGGITAHLSATAQGYSIQNANTLGFTPPGFAGRIIYPNSIFLADLLIHFDQPLTEFSIMYACQELGCDDAATMRVTAFMNGSYVGTNTRTATFPGTWPVDTLRCSFPQGFDSVVVHYDHRPPTCQDYGTIFVADNMRVTPVPVSVISENEFPGIFTLEQNYPNPFNPVTSINYKIPKDAFITFKIFNPLGVEVFGINEFKKAGNYQVEFDGSDLASGMYFYKLVVGDNSNKGVLFNETKKMVLIK
ncbi:MAG: T9SS type A sorting domain-containing protein [Ignavibacteria bacterium]